ncbi:hypothetical protein [Chelativorans sp. M5D2P16]|uniref:hypothetical protein n=1 Tax=Chelativorans sp. M5D2P16 TaxID=3095678 RepID=UPI002ACA0C47|nr:hypothetical protein [Chelativorans sp. M5D2P16]MDZ5697966.1 hypothetical protein [Chelativorans sp. M5D2P16]
MTVAVAVSCSSAFAQSKKVPEKFLYAGSGELEELRPILKRPGIDGIQVVYSWKALEPAFNEYDFSAIEHDLALTDSLGKKLFIQIQDSSSRLKRGACPTTS